MPDKVFFQGFLLSFIQPSSLSHYKLEKHGGIITVIMRSYWNNLAPDTHSSALGPFRNCITVEFIWNKERGIEWRGYGEILSRVLGSKTAKVITRQRQIQKQSHYCQKLAWNVLCGSCRLAYGSNCKILLLLRMRNINEIQGEHEHRSSQSKTHRGQEWAHSNGQRPSLTDLSLKLLYLTWL